MADIKHPSCCKKRFGSKYIKLINKCDFPIYIEVSDDPDCDLKTSNKISISLKGIHSSHTYAKRKCNVQMLNVSANATEKVRISTPTSFITARIKASDNSNTVTEAEWQIFLQKCPIKKQETITFTNANVTAGLNSKN